MNEVRRCAHKANRHGIAHRQPLVLRQQEIAGGRNKSASRMSAPKSRGGRLAHREMEFPGQPVSEKSRSANTSSDAEAGSSAVSNLPLCGGLIEAWSSWRAPAVTINVCATVGDGICGRARQQALCRAR